MERAERLILLGIGLLAMVVTGKLPWQIAAGYPLLSAVTWLVYRKDKQAAGSGRWRTPESTLQRLAWRVVGAEAPAAQVEQVEFPAHLLGHGGVEPGRSALAGAAAVACLERRAADPLASSGEPVIRDEAVSGGLPNRPCSDNAEGESARVRDPRHRRTAADNAAGASRSARCRARSRSA